MAQSKVVFAVSPVQPDPSSTDTTERAENYADAAEKRHSPLPLFSETLKSLTAKQSSSKG